MTNQEKQKALFAKYFAMPAKIGAQEWEWNPTRDYILIALIVKVRLFQYRVKMGLPITPDFMKWTI
jgi:hypothetical protein